MPNAQPPSPVANDRKAEEMERALRRAGRPGTEEPDIAADDAGASAAAEERADEDDPAGRS